LHQRLRKFIGRRQDIFNGFSVVNIFFMASNSLVMAMMLTFFSTVTAILLSPINNVLQIIILLILILNPFNSARHPQSRPLINI
jgi:hypothetical protein